MRFYGGTQVLAEEEKPSADLTVGLSDNLISRILSIAEHRM